MTQTQRATAQIFLSAFRGLTKTQRQDFLEALLREQPSRQDLLDLALAEARRHQPSRPLRDYLAARSHRPRRSHIVYVRVGDYRILYTIDDVARCVEIIAIGHRRNVYR